MLLKDNSKFEHKEAWMEDCQKTYPKLKIDTEDYLREITISKEKENRSEVSAHTMKSQERLSAKTKNTRNLQLTREKTRVFIQKF